MPQPWKPTRATPPRSCPPRPSLKALRDAAASCRGCHLWRPATQTVFGEGPRKARVMLVGEVPGDREDREGRPFVGPAGGELDSALQAAGIDRASTYVTNVVKHFNFEERGKRRIHKRPDARAIKACRPWFDAELDVVGPEALVLLGADGRQGAARQQVPADRQRGRPLESDLAPLVLATIHPSAILRERDSDARGRARAAFVDDLCIAAALHAGERRGLSGHTRGLERCSGDTLAFQTKPAQISADEPRLTFDDTRAAESTPVLGSLSVRSECAACPTRPPSSAPRERRARGWAPQPANPRSCSCCSTSPTPTPSPARAPRPKAAPAGRTRAPPA
ncbi:hypothetical protein BH20ACT17_BH20ACT17_19510 [soil metagenome]